MKRYTLLITILLTSILNVNAQTTSKYIVVDQFGYRPDAIEKIAVIRNPLTGFDHAESFSPGGTYALVDASNDNQVFTASPVAWNSGAEDVSSGDQTWWFDFSSYNTPGTYYVLDITNDVKSFQFEIRDDVYNEVLKHAVRTFFYQRVGFAKEEPYAEIGWTDGASHMGSLQDTECRSYDDPNNAATEKDLRGGWYDAGDYNKYTTWTSNYVYEMLQSYDENPTVWTDDYNLPESGNGVADILDEAKWGMDHLLRLQNTDGSMISIVDEDHASPPSSATGRSLYGAVNTSSTLAAAGAFAYGSKVYRMIGMDTYADQLKTAAENAWTWADANPSVIWRNNDAAYGSAGIGAGQQEVNDDYGRLSYKMRAAAHLYEETTDVTYKAFFQTNYTSIHLMDWTFAYPFEVQEQETLLYYTTLPGISSIAKQNIISKYNAAMAKDHNFLSLTNEDDSYLAYLKDYGWGSNSTKAQKGNMFYDVIYYNVNSSDSLDAIKGAERYIHYLHGVNPMNMVYLTNMGDYGAENSANQIYHNWFYDGSALWDEVGVSTYGPAPGFLPGGPNPSYDFDNCCNSSCGSTANTAKCTAMSLTPPKGQPAQKSYLNFNDNWPLNSWSVTENSCGYQMRYIRLLSKFAKPSSQVLGIKKSEQVNNVFELFPNPAKDKLNVVNKTTSSLPLEIYSIKGFLVQTEELEIGSNAIKLNNLDSGIYILQVGDQKEKLVVE